MDLNSLPLKQQHFYHNPNKPIAYIIHFKHPFIEHRTFALKSQENKLTHQLLDEMPHSTDTFSWNSIIQTHLKNGSFRHALATYEQMLHQGIVPDRHTLPRILSASRFLGSLSFGRQLHCQAMKHGLCSDHYVHSALIELYGYLDGANAAKCVFDRYPLRKSSVSWTLLARFYVKEGQTKLAVELFNEMVSSNAEVDSVALVTVIGACGLMKSLQEGRNAHRVAKKCGLAFDVLVSNALLKMYVDCGSVGEARVIFDQMKRRDEISWTVMVSGYVKKGEFNEGLKLFRQMIVEGLKADAAAVASVLPACGRTAAHKKGKEIHGYLLRNGIDMNVRVQNALMDMYVKSGFIEFASKIFSSIKLKDEISWTVMIYGYSLHGKGELGVNLFKEMVKNAKKKIDQIAYATVLYACCTAIMVDEGKFYFESIRSPKVADCALMVALLARGGQFTEARSFIEEKKIARHAEVLRALLDGCRIHRNIRVGKRVVEQLCDLEPLNAENYVLLSNMYAYGGRWDMVDKLKETIREMGLSPKKAYSWIEYRNKVHVFGTGDVSHPRSEGIYWVLERLRKKVEEEEGVKVDADFSLHDVDEERECIPMGHSELLAISFGLISTQAGETIRITKNLGVCRNCHQFAKAISRIEGREMIVKDPSCFHHFKHGCCSCKNF